MAFSFFKKKQEETPLTHFINDLTLWLTQNEGREITVFQLNELLRKNELYQSYYYATSGFQTEHLTTILTMTVKADPTTTLQKISATAWQEQLSASDPARSPLNDLFRSNESYFKLRVKKTAFQIASDLIEKIFPEMRVYQQDKKTGDFVLNVFKELIYACYRLDLARTPQFQEQNQPLSQLQPASALLPLQTMLQKIEGQPLSELAGQYLFTWLLQYSGTITTASAVFASYSSAQVPDSVLLGSQEILQELSTKLATLDLTENYGANDALGLSPRLLKELPSLYQEANEKMAALDQKLQSDHQRGIDQ